MPCPLDASADGSAGFLKSAIIANYFLSFLVFNVVNNSSVCSLSGQIGKRAMQAMLAEAHGTSGSSKQKIDEKNNERKPQHV